MKQLVAIAAGVFLVALPLSAQEAGEWKDESVAKGVTIQSRVRGNSGIREFRAVGTIDASTRVVNAVLNDADAYPQFMPYVAECRLLKRDKDTVVVYQRLSPPLVADRDFTLRTRTDETSAENGPVYRLRWTPANDIGPSPVRGVVRVRLCDGGWLLEPQDESTTRATYTIFTDSGGTLPAFVENSGSRIAIRKLFEAVRKQVKDPKYSAVAD